MKAMRDKIKLYSVAQTARILGVSIATMYSLKRREKIKCIQSMNITKISSLQIKAYVEEKADRANRYRYEVLRKLNKA